MGNSTGHQNAGAGCSMIKLMIVFLTAILSGCSPIHAPQIVDVPVAEKLATPNIPMKPYLPIEDLTLTSTPAEVMKAYVASVETLNGYSFSLLKILQGYQ